MKISATFDSASRSPCVLRGKMRQCGKGSKQSIRIYLGHGISMHTLVMNYCFFVFR